jgi:hypothetical protein
MAFDVLNTTLNSSGAYGVNRVDLVDHEFPSSVVIQAGAVRVIEGFSLGILRKRRLFHVWYEPFDFFADQFNQPLLNGTCQPHFSEI